MTFQEAVAACFRKYAVFEGRARRSEYWWFFLFSILMQGATGLIDAAVLGSDDIGLVNGLYNLAVFLPSLAVSVRRLHDIERSGWWLLVSLVPVVGVILLIVWFTQPGRGGANRYGPDPTRTG